MILTAIGVKIAPWRCLGKCRGNLCLLFFLKLCQLSTLQSFNRFAHSAAPYSLVGGRFVCRFLSLSYFLFVSVFVGLVAASLSCNLLGLPSCWKSRKCWSKWSQNGAKRVPKWNQHRVKFEQNANRRLQWSPDGNRSGCHQGWAPQEPIHNRLFTKKEAPRSVFFSPKVIDRRCAFSTFHVLQCSENRGKMLKKNESTNDSYRKHQKVKMGPKMDPKLSRINREALKITKITKTTVFSGRSFSKFLVATKNIMAILR